MRGMNYIILNLLHKQKHIDFAECAENQTSSISENLEDSLYSDDLYGFDEIIQQQVDNDSEHNLKRYTFDISYMYSLKEARRSSERKAPFAIIKAQDKKSKISEFDNIYATDKKIKYKDQRQGIRVGFIRGSDHLKYVKYDLESTDKLSGIANEEIPIRKKKGFNQKKLGYIKLAEKTASEDYYIEVTKSRGILWMLLTALIAMALVLMIQGHDWSDWHFNWNGLTAYKTTATEHVEEHLMEINHQAIVDLEGNKLDIDLTSNEASQKFQIRIYNGTAEDGLQLYESNMLEAGSGLETVEVQGADNLEPGDYNCTIICNVYKESGGYLGSLESHFIMRK